MNKFSLFFTVFCFSCATTTPQPPPLEKIDTDLKPYVEEFKRDCQKYSKTPAQCLPLIRLTVRVKDISDPVWGVCYTFDKPYSYLKIVEIDTETTLNETILKLVIYHELMHCVLGYNHYDETLDIMNSSVDIKTAEYLTKYFDFFMNQVFNRENGKNE